MSALSRPLASISSDPLEGLKVTAANRIKNILLGSFDPSSLPYAFLKSQIDDQAVRATAAGAFNRKWEIATPTQRSFARAASYEDELAQRIAELASYKFNPTPPRGGGGGGKTAVNLGENLGGSGNLSGGGLTPQTAQSVKAALNPQTQTPQAAQTAQNIKQALNAQTPQPQPTLSPNLQKPNLTPQTAEVVTPTTVKAAEAVAPLGREVAAAKTARYVDEFAKTSDFKALSSDKQEAILSLKEIVPERISNDLKELGEFENIQVHFSGKQDELQRKKYSKLYELTTQKPDFKLEVVRNGEVRNEYIKAFEHKANKDLFYIAITQESDQIKITGIPTTQISQVVKDIARSERVLNNAGISGAVKNPAELNKTTTLEGNYNAFDTKSQVAETNIQKEVMRPLDAKIAKNKAELAAVKEQMAAKYPEETRELLKEEGITEIRGLIDSRWYNKILRTHPKDKLAQRFAELDKENERLGLLEANADSFTRKYKEELAKDIIELFRKEIGVKNDKESAVEYWVKKGFAPSEAEKKASMSLKLIADSRLEIETYLDIRPIAEFGTNYAEFYRDGAGAVKKLMAQKQGQVAGAFYREELGDIDLVWGDGTKGLRHILERRAAVFEKQGLTKAQATQKALEFVEDDLNNIITKGALELPRDKNGVLLQNPQKMFFHLDDKKSVVAVDYQGDRKWVLTAYFKSGDDTPRSAYPHKSKAHGDDFSTSSSAVSSSGILPQNAGKSQVAELEDDLMKRFEAFEKQAQNDKVDVDSWFEAQRKQGNKDVLEYDKDLEIYRKMQSQARKQAQKASFKKYGLQWLKQYKSFFENKTDEELIALFKQDPETQNAHEKLNFIRKRLQELFDIQPSKKFGTNYAEFYRDGAGAVKKLMAQKQGQVAGAFYREELGDIDLVWGNEKIGLQKILNKHSDDFADFKGSTQAEKLATALGEIMTNGKVLDENGVNTIYFENGGKYYLVGLSEGFNGIGGNKWIITSYEVKNIKPRVKEQISGANKTFSADESLKEPQTFGSTADTANSSKNLAQSQGEVVKTAIKEALKGHKKAPAVKHKGLKELEAVLKERLKEASGDVSFQRAQAREWRQTLKSAQEAQKSSGQLDHLKFRLAEKIGDFRHAQRVRTDYEAKLRELGGVESSFKELSKKLSKLSKNPKPQDLSELFALKEGLLRVEGSLRGVEVRGNAAFNKLRSEVTQALEKSFDAINTAKKGLTPKAAEAVMPTRTQEFLDFTQDAKERVEWALGVSLDAAEKTIDELVKKSGGESARLKFLERLRASVKALGQESEAVTPKRAELVVDEFNSGKKIFDLYSSRNFIQNEAYKPNLPSLAEEILPQTAVKSQVAVQKANLIKERLKNYKKD